jgi:hypothetical protein
MAGKSILERTAGGKKGKAGGQQRPSGDRGEGRGRLRPLPRTPSIPIGARFNGLSRILMKIGL